MSQIDNKIVNVKALLAAQAAAHNIEAVSFNGSDVTPVNKRVSLTETDPTVPAWAKSLSKPSYTANEVGAVAKPVIYVADITDANNGLAEIEGTSRGSVIEFCDKNNRAVGSIHVSAWKDGRTSVAVNVYNIVNSVTKVAHIVMYLDKNGNVSYEVRDNAAFWSAIKSGVDIASSSMNGLMPSSDKSKLDGMEVATLAEVKTALGI